MQWSFQNYIMLKSSRKKLIAIGCSFTSHYLTSIQSPNLNFDFPRWPQHLADMLDMECVNLGKRGAGNDYILAKVLDVTLKEKNIGLIVIMWSEWRRMGFQRFSDLSRWDHISSRYVNVDLKEFILEKQNPLHATRNTMRTFIHAEKNLSDIPYMFLQGTQTVFWNSSYLSTDDSWPRNQKGRREAANEILTSPYLDYIENNISDKFIGWPLMSEIGGYCIDDILDKKDPSRSKFRISRTDTHPNAAGHKFIADFLYEQYKEIYNEH